MSAQKAVTIPPRDQPEIPAYFRKDRVARDEFLSQLGHFNEEQRSVFNRLCDMWEPDLLYRKFFSRAGHEFLNTDVLLHTLMNHLERGNCGLIANTVRQGELEKERIILTDRNSPRFWYWFVENLWHTARVADREDFPSVNILKKKPGFTTQLLQPLSLTEISGRFIQAHENDVIIYVLPALEGNKIVVTPASVYSLIEVSRLKIRAYLSDSPLLPILAKMMKTVVSSLVKSLRHNEDSFWNKLSNTVVNHKEDLRAKITNLPSDIFISAKILKIYTDNELEDAKKQREQEAEKRLTVKAIMKYLIKKDDFLVTKEELDAQFQPYNEQWPDLKDMFLNTYAVPQSANSLPYVVQVNDYYIYRDHVYPLFKTRHSQASLELNDYYQQLAGHILLTKNRDKFSAFTGITAFREDIRERLVAEFPILSDLLSKPRIVSESIIHYSSKIQKTTDMERIKSTLAKYFEGNSLRFKQPEKLFYLSPVELLQYAFRRLGWFRRFLLRLFGRYESYIQSFDRASSGKNTAENQAYTPFPPSSSSAAMELMPGQERRGRHNKKHSKASRGRTVRSKRYSAKQQEEAWNEFKSLYQKNKGRK